MDNKQFQDCRLALGKTQKELSGLLGSSLKSVQSYEQGWRSVPSHVERILLFLVSRSRLNERINKPCWEQKNCPQETRGHCPAWELGAGEMCWFINGTICQGEVKENWEEKMQICYECKVLSDMISPG